MSPVFGTVVFILLMGARSSAWSDVYRCTGPDGVNYADSPCGDNARKINVDSYKIGGRFDTNLPSEKSEATKPSTPAPQKQQSHENDTCRFINSTDLNRHLIRNEIVKGMTREQVRKAFGDTPEVYSAPQETWVYTTDYYGRLYELTYVYFTNGCVERVVYRKP